MSSGRDDLAARKALLLARSNLYRLQLRHEASGLVRAVVRPRTALALVASPPVTSLLVAAVMSFLGRARASRFDRGRERASRLIRGALAALTIAKAVRAWMRRGS